MTLKELHSKVMKEVEKRLGTFDKIVDLEEDTLLCYAAEFYGHSKKYKDFILAILYCDDVDCEFYGIQTTLKNNGDIEFCKDLVEKVDKDKDIYTKADLDNAIKIANEIIDEIVKEYLI